MVGSGGVPPRGSGDELCLERVDPTSPFLAPFVSFRLTKEGRVFIGP